MKAVSKSARRLGLILLISLGLLAALNFLLQHGLAHLSPPHRPDYPAVDLTAVLAKPALTDDDFALLFAQTGLGRPAIEDYLARGELGRERILATQDGYFNPPEFRCTLLIPTTMEERFTSDGVTRISAVPLAPLRQGDILVSFSTHTAGWRHGHAGLVVDAGRGVTIESVSLGSLSAYIDANHWTTYPTFAVLRPRGLDDTARWQVADFAMKHLADIPYRLTSGLLGAKAPDPEGDLAAHCAYLPWYAYMQFGLDLDSNGGVIVTVADLARSPYLEVVQIYGIDPAELMPGI